MLKRPVEDGKKLFLWREVLVLMDRSLLPEGSSWHRESREESATIFLARLRVLEVCRSSMVGILQPITFSAARKIRCSLLLSLAVAAAYQTVMEEVRMTQ